MDSDAAAYCARSGATDRAAINAFVRGVKNLGLWNSLVCWPLRSSQNSGTGTTAYSLGGLGTFNGTLTNGPAWGADGITVDANNERITTSFNYATGLVTVLAVIKPDVATGGVDLRFAGNDQGGTSNGINFDTIPAAQFRLLPGLNFVGTRSAGTRTMFGHGRGTANTFWVQDGARSALTDGAYNSTAQTFCPIGSPTASTALGETSFTVAFDGVTTTSSLLSSFYTLYKSTLGTGLGLP